MLKNLFTLPDTFDPDDGRRRQVLNILLILLILISLAGLLLTFLIVDFHFESHGNMEGTDLLFIPLTIFVVVLSILLVVNRSAKVPGWLSATALVALVTAVITQMDTPKELYDGRSLIAWVLPIMIGAIILHPRSIFIITAVVFGMMQLFTPAADGGVNYYAVGELSMTAFIAWLGMTIANRAIHDARREAANLQAIYNHVADGVLVLNPQGKFLSANPALLKMIPQEELEEISAQPLGDTLLWKRKVFSVHASPVPEMGTVAVFRDETRRHETERARDALIATASHELRTPLAAAMNYLELLLTLVRLERVNTSEFKEHLTRALENSRRLQQLVDNILDQAQIQAGVLELKRQPFDLSALLEKSRQLLDTLIRQKQLAYQLSISPEVPVQIIGDAERLQQVLVNLIGNAVKFTDHGGVEVRVSVAGHEKLSIQVTDSGPGIPPEQLPDIFEAFRRGSDYAQRERQGAGLGLSIVKEIVNRMGGEISAASEPGRGATISVLLPLERA